MLIEITLRTTNEASLDKAESGPVWYRVLAGPTEDWSGWAPTFDAALEQALARRQEISQRLDERGSRAT